LNSLKSSASPKNELAYPIIIPIMAIAMTEAMLV